jgi:hypothetical protein
MEITEQIISAVQNVSESDECVRAVLDYFAARERDPRDRVTRVRNMEHSLDGRFDFNAIQDGFERLQGCNVGELRRGRTKARFRWFVSARDLAAQIKRPNGNRSNGNGVDLSREDEAMETFSCPVRRGVTLPFQIRRDMGYEELINLSVFIKVIAESRRTAPENNENG